MTHQTSTDRRQLTASEQISAISKLVVRTTAAAVGRGPTSAQTTITENAIFVVLGDTMTKAEHGLVQAGRGNAVLRLRREFQSTMRDELIEGVLQITGRAVAGFMSTNHNDPDFAVEIFILHPR